jgi:3-deoxy-D-arabino-heptulosonate 7-phosphate (DAHP) synthase
VTDACINWETTENTLIEMSDQLTDILKSR